jgi:hypothetical protein
MIYAMWPGDYAQNPGRPAANRPDQLLPESLTDVGIDERAAGRVNYSGKTSIT